MQAYQDPNAREDGPVKRQIIMVLVGFIVMTAIIATVVNITMK